MTRTNREVQTVCRLCAKISICSGPAPEVPQLLLRESVCTGMQSDLVVSICKIAFQGLKAHNPCHCSLQSALRKLKYPSGWANFLKLAQKLPPPEARRLRPTIRACRPAARSAGAGRQYGYWAYDLRKDDDLGVPCSPMKQEPRPRESELNMSKTGGQLSILEIAYVARYIV